MIRQGQKWTTRPKGKEFTILLSTAEQEFANRLNSSPGFDRGNSIRVFANVKDLSDNLGDNHVSVAIIDIDGDSQCRISELAKLVNKCPNVNFAVVSSSTSPELIMQSMRAGARDFILKEEMESELDQILERLIVGNSGGYTSRAPGRIISVLSASGGCGGTTVAVNLANELQLSSTGQVCTVDMDSYYSAISTYLGLTSRYNIHEIMSRKEEVDSHLLMSSALVFGKGLRVITGRNLAEDSFPTETEISSLSHLLKTCREAFSYTVIDAPRLSKIMAKELVCSSDMAMIVFELSVKDICMAKSMISTLRNFGMNEGAIFPVANKFSRSSRQVSIQDAHKAIGMNIHRVRSDFGKVSRCINHGELLSSSAGRSGIRKDLIKLSQLITANQTVKG